MKWRGFILSWKKALGREEGRRCLGKEEEHKKKRAEREITLGQERQRHGVEGNKTIGSWLYFKEKSMNTGRLSGRTLAVCMNAAAGSPVRAHPSVSCFHSIRHSDHTCLVLSLPQADRKWNIIKQGRRKENGEKKKRLPDSQYFDTKKKKKNPEEGPWGRRD